MNISVDIAGGLRLLAIGGHNVFECGVEFAISAKHVDRTHQNLIQMAIFLQEEETNENHFTHSQNRQLCGHGALTIK